MFTGSDVERINFAIEATAKAGGGKVVVPRGLWLIDSAILVRSDITLVLDNCRIKLSDKCRDNMIRSANCGVGVTDIKPMRNVRIIGVGNVVFEGADHPRATGDSGKKLIMPGPVPKKWKRESYGTDAGVAGENTKGDWRNIGILLAYVDGFSIENVKVVDSHCWAISLERCGGGVLRDINFASRGYKMIDGVKRVILNQDGIDLRQGCYDILIENVSGFTGDDTIALTGISGGVKAGSLTSTMVSGTVDRGNGLDDIRDIEIGDVRASSKFNIVRILNTGGCKLHDVIIDGLIDTSGEDRRCFSGVRIGDAYTGYGKTAALGETARIIINNVITKSRDSVKIEGSLCDSVISNVVHYGEDGEAVSIGADKVNIRNVKIIGTVAVE
jgi:hypothetical protein